MRPVLAASLSRIVAALTGFVGLAALLSPAGCVSKHPMYQAAGAQRRAVVFLVDGLDATVLDAMLERGELPVIEREFVRGGARVRNAVNALPTVTYANVATLLTGVWPARHGILGNRWFDPVTRRARDYGHAGTFRSVNDDLRVPTLFELLSPRPTAAVQLHTRRGASKVIDFTLANGLDWALGRYDRVDARAAKALPRLDRFASRIGRWPALTVYYFPGVDEAGHRYGPDTPRYRDAIRIVDATIGRILDGLRARQLYRRSVRVLVSDHGMIRTPAGQRFDLTRWLARRTRLRVRALSTPLADPSARRMRLRKTDVVVVADAGRRAHLHTLRTEPTRRPAGHPTARAHFDLGASLFDLHTLPAIDLVCLRRADGCAEVRSRRGTAIVQRRTHNGRKHYRVQLLSDRDPWAYDVHPSAAPLLDGRWHASRTWLSATADSPYPDFVPQIVDLFDTPRAGQIIVFAASGWTLRPEPAGSHGGASRRDRIVPMFFAGDNIPPQTEILAARTADLVPTLLQLLDATPPNSHRFDGVPLSLR